MKQLLFLILCIVIVETASAQQALKLSCPLRDLKTPPAEKKTIDLGMDQPKVYLMSASDTTARACISGTVTSVMRDEAGEYEVMFHNKDHYFWYSGLTKALVRKGQKVQDGEPIGILKTGEVLELMLYDFETPVDPKKYLFCGE